MKTETLKIEIPKGFQVESFNEATGEIRFKPKPKPVTERIKTFEDVLDDLGNEDEDVRQYKKLIGVFLDDKNHILNYHRATLIAKALNEGWKPDFTDGKWKYLPWFKMGSPSGAGFSFHDYDRWLTHSAVGARLFFKNRELAEYAGKQFEDIYKNYLTT